MEATSLDLSRRNVDDEEFLRLVDDFDEEFCAKIEFLFLIENRLKHFPDVSRFVNLTWLDLRSNLIESFDYQG